jgi:hypothetical protein
VFTFKVGETSGNSDSNDDCNYLYIVAVDMDVSRCMDVSRTLYTTLSRLLL